MKWGKTTIINWVSLPASEISAKSMSCYAQIGSIREQSQQTLPCLVQQWRRSCEMGSDGPGQSVGF